jgi:ATP synthase I chain
METMTQADGDQDGTNKVPTPGAEVNLALMATGGIGLLASLVALLFWDGRVGAGVFVGAALAVANLWVFKRLGHAFLSEKGKSRAMWGLIAVFKFVALMIGVALLLRHDVVGAIPLIVGYGALPVGITLSNFMAARIQDEG